LKIADHTVDIRIKDQNRLLDLMDWLRKKER